MYKKIKYLLRELMGKGCVIENFFYQFMNVLFDKKTLNNKMQRLLLYETVKRFNIFKAMCHYEANQ